MGVDPDKDNFSLVVGTLVGAILVTIFSFALNLYAFLVVYSYFKSINCPVQKGYENILE